MPLSGQACIHIWTPIDNRGSEALLTDIEGREEGVAELQLQPPNVMYAGRLRNMSRHRGAGRGVYVCAYDSRWDGVHVQHISLLSRITYIVPGGGVRSLLQKKRTGRGMALTGCIMEGRPPPLQ
jgi:hypothetical protein